VPDFATARHPVWSPDSRHLLFIGNRAAGNFELDWYFVPVEGGSAIKTGAIDALRRAGAASETDRPIPTAWTKHDEAVLVGATAGARSNVWELSISSLTGMVVGSPRRLTFGTAVERNPSVASNGRVAFSSLVENVDIWRMRLDPKTGLSDGDLERVSENPAEDRIMNVIGKSLAFISSRTQQNELWIKDLETGTERQVTRSGANVARLSPDGSKVAFWGRSLGSIGVKILDMADSSTAAPCPDCERAFGWAPDGSRLLLAKAKPSRLFEYHLPSGRLTELTSHSKWLLREGRYSPDGRWVAFYSANGPDERQVHIVQSTPAHPVLPEQWLTVIDDVGSMPNWSDDGSLLYYISERDGALCLWVQPLDPLTKQSVGPPRAVQHFHQPRLRAGTGAIATTDVRDGYAYITLTETTGNIWMLEPADD
jgi:Tol biopolymer transport system component